jgi:hypothetical protein
MRSYTDGEGARRDTHNAVVCVVRAQALRDVQGQIIIGVS